MAAGVRARGEEGGTFLLPSSSSPPPLLLFHAYGVRAGSTLSITYAETHPDRVLELILRGAHPAQPVVAHRVARWLHTVEQRRNARLIAQHAQQAKPQPRGQCRFKMAHHELWPVQGGIHTREQ